MNTTDKAIIAIEELSAEISRLRREVAAVTAERDTAQATLQRLSDATAIRWLDGYPDGLEARVARLVEYTAETKMHSLEAFEELRAEVEVLRAALDAIQDIAVDYCHNDISVQIKYDTDGALNRILAITQDGPQ